MNSIKKAICALALCLPTLLIHPQPMSDEQAKELKATPITPSMCKTIHYGGGNTKPATLLMRAMAHQALTEFELPNPEKMMICVLSGHPCYYIPNLMNFNYLCLDNYQRTAPLGALRATIYHQAWCEAHSEEYNIEKCRIADMQGVKKACCQKCAKDYINHFLHNHHARLHPEHYYFEATAQKYLSSINVSIKNIDDIRSLTTEKYNDILTALSNLPHTRDTDHAFDMERALYLYPLLAELDGNTCSYHKNWLHKLDYKIRDSLINFDYKFEDAALWILRRQWKTIY